MPAAAAPTSMPQAWPSSAIVGAHSTSTPASRHWAAMGEVMRSSAFSARKTLLHDPSRSEGPNCKFSGKNQNCSLSIMSCVTSLSGEMPSWKSR